MRWSEGCFPILKTDVRVERCILATANICVCGACVSVEESDCERAFRRMISFRQESHQVAGTRLVAKEYCDAVVRKMEEEFF